MGHRRVQHKRRVASMCRWVDVGRTEGGTRLAQVGKRRRRRRPPRWLQHRSKSLSRAFLCLQAFANFKKSTGGNDEAPQQPGGAKESTYLPFAFTRSPSNRLPSPDPSRALHRFLPPVSSRHANGQVRILRVGLTEDGVAVLAGAVDQRRWFARGAIDLQPVPVVDAIHVVHVAR